MSNFTPAPWIARFYKSGEKYLVYADNAPHVSGAVCIVGYDNSGGSLRQPVGEELDQRRAIGQANAELIAFAPEMYTALAALNPADPLAAANALPDVVAALEAIIQSNETALPIELAERAEDALNALKGAK